MSLFFWKHKRPYYFNILFSVLVYDWLDMIHDCVWWWLLITSSCSFYRTLFLGVFDENMTLHFLLSAFWKSASVIHNTWSETYPHSGYLFASLFCFTYTLVPTYLWNRWQMMCATMCICTTFCTCLQLQEHEMTLWLSVLQWCSSQGHRRPCEWVVAPRQSVVWSRPGTEGGILAELHPKPSAGCRSE